jgi:hypothetical protein
MLSKLNVDPSNGPELTAFAAKLAAWSPNFDGLDTNPAKVGVQDRQSGTMFPADLACTITLAHGGGEDKIPMLWPEKK